MRRHGQADWSMRLQEDETAYLINEMEKFLLPFARDALSGQARRRTRAHARLRETEALQSPRQSSGGRLLRILCRGRRRSVHTTRATLRESGKQTSSNRLLPASSCRAVAVLLVVGAVLVALLLVVVALRQRRLGVLELLRLWSSDGGV